jgi:hypothetical protein
MLEDDETNPPSIKATAVPVSVDAGIVSVDTGIMSVAKLSKPADTRQEAWYDVEDGRYVFEDCPLSLLEEDGLASTLAQDHHHLSGLLEEPINQYSNEDAQCMSEEIEADTLTRTLDEDSGQNCESRRERDMLVETEAQGPLLSAAAPSSPRPHPHSSDPAHPLMDQEPGRIGTKCDGLEELRHGSSPRPQVEEGGPQEEQYQKAAVDAMREASDSNGEPERGAGGGNCHYHDGRAEPGSDCRHEGNLGEDDNDEKLRPAKRRKRHSQPLQECQTPIPDTDTDTSEEWEIRNIVGRKTVGGEVQYLVAWETTWMRESDLTGARELIDEFMSLLPKRGQQEMSESNASGKGEPKKRRGRPPKQTGQRGR